MILEYSCAMQRRNIHRRREKNVFKYAIGAIAILFHIYTEVLHAAPTSYDSLLPQSSDISEYFSDISGCYYNFQRYEEGDRIVTNEPCLNCTCHNRMLMCYLRVCPFTKAIGQDCTIEKKPDQCCPIITCPEVPVKLLTSSTTSSPTPTTQTTEVGFHDNYGCSIHDSFYPDGAQVPADPKKPCELCYCIRNRTACVMQECTLQVEGCKPVYQEEVCCPVRYDCDYEREITSTLRLQTSGGFIKSTTYASVVDCQYENQSYSDGELITTDKPCEHCYCMRGDIVCAVQECGEPLRGKDCVPTAPPPERCCPSSYECPTDTQSTESIIKETYFSNATEIPNRISTPEKLTTIFEASTIKYNRPTTILSQEEIYNRLGESTSKVTTTEDRSTEQAKDTHSTSSQTPLADYQPEDVQHDSNVVGEDEHHTTFSDGPHKDKSSSSSEGTTEQVSTSMIANTGKPAPISDQQITSASPHIDDSIQNEDNQSTLVTDRTNEITSSDEITRKTTSISDQHLPLSQADSLVTTDTYTKLSQTTKPDTSEIVEKVTDLSHKNPTTVVDVSEPVTTTFETVTKLSSKPADSVEYQPSEIFVSNDKTPEYHTETSQYVSTTTNDYMNEKIATTVREETVTDKTSTHGATQEMTELEDEQTTESLNTVSNKNTDSVSQDDSQLSNSKAPQFTTQLPKISAETTITDLPSSQDSEIKPEYPIYTTSGTPEGEKESTTTSAGIPGEGSCLVDGITYLNSSIIESSNPCHSKCVCLSSIPTCTLVTCESPPADPKCMPIQIKPESCCPAYVCGGNDPPSPTHSISSDNHIAPSHRPNDEYTTEDIISTTIVPLRSSTPSSTSNSDINQDLQNTIDAQEKQTIAPSDEITGSKLSTLKPLTSIAVPSSDNGLLLDKIPDNGLASNEPEVILPEHDLSQVTIKEQSSDLSQVTIKEQSNDLSQVTTKEQSSDLSQVTIQEQSNDLSQVTTKEQSNELSQVTIQEQSSSPTSILQEFSTVVDKDTPLDVTSHYSEQPVSLPAASDENTVTIQQENDLVQPESNFIPEQHDQTLSTTLPSIIPNKVMDNGQEITTLGNVISESNNVGEEQQGETVTITSLPVSSTIKHISTDFSTDTQYSTTIKLQPNIASDNSDTQSFTTIKPHSNIASDNFDDQFPTTIKPHSNIASDNSEEESEIGTTPQAVFNDHNEDNLIVSHHSNVTTSISEPTEGYIQTEENVADTTTVTPQESDNIDTKSSLSPLSTIEHQNQPQTSTAFTTTLKASNNDEISETTLAELSSGSVGETTLLPEQIHTTILPDNDPLQKFSSFLTTLVTPESVKQTTDRTTFPQTEIYESTIQNSEPATTQATESSSSMAAEDAKPEDGATTILNAIPSSPTSLFSSEVTSDLNKITNKFGNVPTEYLPSEMSSVAGDHLYEEETTTEKESAGAIEKDDRTTLPPSSSSQSPYLIESSDLPTDTNETDAAADSSPTTVSHREELVQQHDTSESSATTTDQQQSITISKVTPTLEPQLPTTITDTRPSFSTEKHASAITDSPSVTSETTSTSSFEPIQHSTWTRKPTEETITSTSEANYYPQSSAYPPGNDHSHSGGEAGTGLEEYDEDNGAFGPGTCRYAGKVYVSAQQIPRDDPCDFCFCFRSDIICLQQSCPPPIHGCRQEPILGFCCPRYECPVASYTSQNSSAITSTTTTSTTLAPSRPPRFPAESYRSSVRRTGCLIHGYFYNVGDEISIASGPCLECTCGSDGGMKCDPKSCSPEPYVQQMVAESAYRKR